MKVRFGTPVSEVLSGRLKENIPSRIIINSLLTGFQLKDFKFPIDKKFSQIIAIPEKTDREFLPFLSSGKKSDSFTNTFLAKILPVFNKLPDTNIHGEKRPCISCGFCEDVCPVRIIPHLLYKYINKGIIDETLKKYEIFNCINCCLCSYVCPSKIPLFERIKEGQEKLLKQGCDRDQCDLPHFDIEIIEEYRGATRL
ncbi:4Fe-4S dicluster domain-containing protein [Candidatus Desantisbacteria bacterium]|nr:4Fe-4S dicluster domain-containing protein [Candidatus Desantisbacteria bacterium]